MFATSFNFALKVTKPLKGKKSQFKFGVVTKSDTFHLETRRQRAQKKCKATFEEKVEGEKEVYFVEAENATVAMVSFVFVYSGNLIGAN